MKVLGCSLLLALCVGVQAAPAKLDDIASLLGGYNYGPPQAPSAPSGLYELPGPPPPPVIPPRTTTTTTTTTPPPPPPPPVGLYEAPDFALTGGAANNANRFAQFVTVREPLPTPEVPKVQFSQVTRPTPSNFVTPMAPKNMDGPYMPYEITYGIQDAESGNVYSHVERSEGNDVQGEYRVLLPDGRTQVVTFYADPDSGYNAQVTYV